MKEYKIYFSDYTETTGKAANKAEMLKEAKKYIRAWNLDVKVEYIEEIKDRPMFTYDKYTKQEYYHGVY